MNHLVRSAKQLGHVIKLRRVERNLSQKELGLKANLRQATISEIESGKNANMDSLVAIMVALNLEMIVRDRTEADKKIEDIF
jgi:HTH-type transcriptional regulator/antitoxin HipB